MTFAELVNAQAIYQKIKLGPEAANQNPLEFVRNSANKIVILASMLTAKSIGLNQVVVFDVFSDSVDELLNCYKQFYDKEGEVIRGADSESDMLTGIKEFPGEGNLDTLRHLVCKASLPLPSNMDEMDTLKSLPFTSIMDIVRKIMPIISSQEKITDSDEIMTLVSKFMDKENYGDERKVGVSKKLQAHLNLNSPAGDGDKTLRLSEGAARVANVRWQIAKLHQAMLEGNTKRLEQSQFNTFDDMVESAYLDFLADGYDPSEAEVLTAYKIFLDIAEFED